MTLSYVKGCGLAVIGGGITLREILTNGSLLLTCIGGTLAVLGGYWAYRCKRAEARIRELELRIKERQLAALEKHRRA